MENENNECKHSACACSTADGTDYCSEYCREAGRQDITEISCGCEHPGCMMT